MTPSARPGGSSIPGTGATALTAVLADAAHHLPSGIGELDRVLGGGVVPGATMLLAGEPGVGKSTLLLQLASALGRPGAPSLVVTGEESSAQVRLRAERTGSLQEHVLVAEQTDVAEVAELIGRVRPGLLIVDSVQTLTCGGLPGAAGSVAQVRESAAAIGRLARELSIPAMLIGHVTKDGGIAGPRVLEHLVDVVLTLEGDRHAALRLLRAVKNRFGVTDEVGCFLLQETGLSELADPSGIFLSRPAGGDAAPGSCVTVTLEGRRPLLCELQALITPAEGQPRRGVTGLDPARTAVLLAVVERRGGIALQGKDIFVAPAAGLRLREPAADLATALAVASAACWLPLPASLIAFGEVGLGGELRPVPATERRLRQAARLGFRQAIVPSGPHASPAEPPRGMTVTAVPSLVAAIAHLIEQGSLLAPAPP